MSYRCGGLEVVLFGGLEVELPVCPMPFDEPVTSGLVGGGAAASGVAGETVVAFGLVLGMALGFPLVIELGLVSGGIVLLGLVAVPLGLVAALGLVVLCIPLGFCEPALGELTEDPGD
ncbi:MAG: hypothetical protein ACLPND_10655 [Candidatus Korobacteraceae bacterium]